LFWRQPQAPPASRVVGVLASGAPGSRPVAQKVRICALFLALVALSRPSSLAARGSKCRLLPAGRRPSGEVGEGRRETSRVPIKQPVALRPLSQAGSTATGSSTCTTLLALPTSQLEPQPLPCRCLHVGSSEFTSLHDVAQTQHVIECFSPRSRVYIPKKRFETHQRHKACTRT
jgi:hypothetical protein